MTRKSDEKEMVMILDNEHTMDTYTSYDSLTKSKVQGAQLAIASLFVLAESTSISSRAHSDIIQ